MKSKPMNIQAVTLHAVKIICNYTERLTNIVKMSPKKKILSGLSYDCLFFFRISNKNFRRITSLSFTVFFFFPHICSYTSTREVSEHTEWYCSSSD